MNRLSRSGIDYLDYHWGIFSGCHNYKNGICAVKNCWAKGIALHYPKLYPNGFEPTFYPEALESPMHINWEPKRIGVGWVGDIIGYGLDYKDQIYKTIKQTPWHTYLFLTKNPEQLQAWSSFPKNCWVGVTATDSIIFAAAYYHLANISAKVKYISIEPLLDWDERVTKAMIHQASQAGINWVILGLQTNPYKPPKVEWVEEIVMECIKAGIPVWLKDNLVKALPPTIPFYVPPKEVPEKGKIEMRYRQEIPLDKSNPLLERKEKRK